MTDFKHVEEQIASLKERGAREHLLSVLDAADTMQALLDENRRLRKLLSMWLQVNDWDEGVGGLRWNTIVALTNLQEQSDDD
jgi:hypothetical protein